ncbi:unnamed protein product [Clonostachys rosea]|uniref:Ketoreductase domain-containing protein n=1 Tax=Bionectria ochroleuca TaxID=29856 RepID=A0ABY6UY16_BIOOC|nr:unnamed protein product [Clonostachys rosea]
MSQPGSQEFQNRTVIVTGAAGSIGAPLCLALARAGANVVANDYGCSASGEGSSSDPVTELVEKIKAEGLVAISDTHDVSTEAKAIVDAAVAKFGQVDVIINNAGIIQYGDVETQGPDVVEKIFQVNALGAYALCHYAWPHMKRQGYGRVVNFTSDSIFGMVNSSAYVMARGAMLGITRSLALEGAPHGILVNTVAPSAFSRLVADVSKDLPTAQLEWFKATYTGESNLPVIMALASEKVALSGEIWNSGAYCIGRDILGTTKNITDINTTDDCLKAMEKLKEGGLDWAEPKSVPEFLGFKSGQI